MLWLLLFVQKLLHSSFRIVGKQWHDGQPLKLNTILNGPPVANCCEADFHNKRDDRRCRQVKNGGSRSDTGSAPRGVRRPLWESSITPENKVTLKIAHKPC